MAKRKVENEKLHWHLLKGVHRIVDGDNCWLILDRDFGDYSIKNVRLSIIDADEKDDPDPVKRARAKLAEEYLTAALRTDKEILVRSYKGDGFGRWLGEVYIDGVYLNKQMLDLGIVDLYK